MKELMIPLLNELMNELMDQLMKEIMKQSINQLMKQLMNPLMNQLMNQPQRLTFFGSRGCQKTRQHQTLTGILDHTGGKKRVTIQR